MSVHVIGGSSDKPAAAAELKELFREQTMLDGTLYIAYPILPSPDGPLPLDAIFLSQEYGLLIINMVEGESASHEDILDSQDNSFNKMEAKLKGYKNLSNRRKLEVQMDCLTFAPAIPEKVVVSTTNTFNKNNFSDVLKKIEKNNYSEDKYKILTSTIQNIPGLANTQTKRKITNSESRGAKLEKVERTIATLDLDQSTAVIESVNDVQRIRGLAGSGKTIVLALKAAYLHARHPDWKIAITFNTRSLKGLYRKLINKFYYQQTAEFPNYDNIQIIHAWGSNGRKENNGIYYSFCDHQNVSYYRDFQSAKSSFGYDHAFSGACKEAITNKTSDVPMFDAILVDEAQDFSKYFLQICYSMLKEKKRLVYAYDELQNLSNESLPSPENIFGNGTNGKPLVKFESPSQDIILKKCYRNPRPILVSAHALGFGIYRKIDPRTGTGLLQMFENKKLWGDIGYFNNGPIVEDENVSLYRTDETSPSFLEEHSKENDLLEIEKFNNQESQTSWLIKEIEKNIKEDELRPSDIIVINPNPLTTKSEVGILRKALLQKGINSTIAGEADPDVFINGEDSVTFSGIFRVKGNEAAMIYVINAQDCYNHAGQVTMYRNVLFTAMTRSKAWLRLSGVGDQMNSLIEEAINVKDHQYRLEFTYPNADTRKNLKIINRDLSVNEQNDINSVESNLSNVFSKLRTGSITFNDISPQVLNQLKKLIPRDTDEKKKE